MVCDFQVWVDWTLFFFFLLGELTNGDCRCLLISFRDRQLFWMSVGRTKRESRFGWHLISTGCTARVSMTNLRQMFPAHFVSLRGDARWRARSSDSSICDFFLWGYPTEEVFRKSSLEEFGNWIIREGSPLYPSWCTKMRLQYVKNRLRRCIVTWGRWGTLPIFLVLFSKLNVQNGTAYRMK